MSRSSYVSNSNIATLSQLQTITAARILVLFLLFHATVSSAEEDRHGSKNEKPLAVMHIGPHKTGTSSVQTVAEIRKEAFLHDNYIAIDYQENVTNLPRIGRNIAACLCSGGRKDNFCDTSLMDDTRKLLSDPHSSALQGRNIFFSHESFDHECIDMPELRNLFTNDEEGYDVRIIMGYRRFFEWLISLHGEHTRVDPPAFLSERGKKRFMDRKGVTWPEDPSEPYRTIKHWLTIELMESHYEHEKYTTALLKRYREIFGDESISIFNMHNTTDLAEDFFCYDVPGTSYVCDTLKKEKTSMQARVASTNAYDHIAVSAYNSGLISGKGLTRAQVRDRIRERQEKELGLTPGHLPKDCLDEPVLERLLELSIDAERSLVPDFFASPMGGEDIIKQKFDIAKTTKLCAVDTDELLADEGWISFFDSLERGEGNTNVAREEKEEMR